MGVDISLARVHAYAMNTNTYPTKVQHTIDALTEIGFDVTVRVSGDMFSVEGEYDPNTGTLLDTYNRASVQVVMSATRFYGRYIRTYNSSRKCKSMRQFYSWARISTER